MTKLINALLNPSVYDHAVDKIELLQTHISWVILTGDFAYKIKKPVNFGFLDFSSLGKRRHYCEEELRLNRRLAPQLYLDVITITGSEELPAINGTGKVLEYAVKMRQFPTESLLINMINTGDLREIHMDWLAHSIASFHHQTGVAKAGAEFGTLAAVEKPVKENFQQIRQHIQNTEILKQLDAIEGWCTDVFFNLETAFRKRKQDGFIRECHGDLHLGNIILLHEKIIPFDCIEFNENLRWIDVLSEIAFLVMDLEDHQRPDLARRFLNKYLELTGDYSNLNIFQYYKVYRAMVRAKINTLQLKQEGMAQSQIKAIYKQCKNYVNLGSSYIIDQKPVLIIMHGFSGSGKTTVSQFIVEALPVIRIRSDIERKRLYKLKPTEKSLSGINKGVYNDEASRKTYNHLRRLAEDILLAGKSVIVDAAFLQAEQRKQFAELASIHNMPYHIIDCHAERGILVQRISERQIYGNDASEASLKVLYNQQENHDPLTDEERAISFTIGSTEAMAIKTVTDHLGALIRGRTVPDSFPDEKTPYR
ncbi:MAG TPA: aminoglycoside phosphotransferase [Gammaproteobacteria bacterium]|nr:aminoglycoside phosphotransferase [Gammaproteobacteria bacterium]